MLRYSPTSGEKPVRYDTSGCWQVQPAFEGWAPKPEPLFTNHIRALAWGLIAALGVVLVELVS